MNNYVPYILILLNLAYLYFFARELERTTFRGKGYKYGLFFFVLFTGVFGYAMYTTFKRNWIVKRKFNPKFRTRY